MNLLFRSLDDPTRRKIIELLRKRDMTAGEIADHFKMSKPSISHHLDLLKRAKVVAGVRDGQFISYSLNTAVFDDLTKWIVEMTKKYKA
jgi:ArsR family transcriptional regulator, arsenate/arsenite/antimonite-responsive transcriptional repressor